MKRNGEPGTFVQSNPQEVLKLNDGEWRLLRTIADEYRAQSDILDDAARETTFDVRLGLTAGQDVSRLRQRQSALDRRRGEIVRRQVERLKQELAGRYEELRSFVDSRPSGSYFPRESAISRPVAKTKAKAR